MNSKNFACIALLSIVPACSLSTFDRKSCESSKECRDDLGFGYVCVEDGFCEVAVLNPRCTHTYPENLLSDPAEREGRVIIGSVLEQNVARHSAREHAAETAIAVTSEESGSGVRLGAIFCTVEENYNPEGMGGDGLPRTEATIAMGRHLIDMYGVPAIFGPNLSGDTTALFNELSNNGDDVVIMSPSATAVSLTALEPSATDAAPGLLWRTSPPDLVAPGTIAADMVARNITRIAIIYREGSYGDGLADGVQAAFVAANGSNTVVRYAYSDDSVRGTQLGQAAMDANAGDFDEVLFLGNGEGDVENLVSIADSSFPDTMTYMFGDSGASEGHFDQASISLLGRIRGVRPKPLSAQASTVYAAYLASFASRFPQPGEADSQKPFAANAFDGGWMLAGGVVWAAAQETEITGTTIARGLRQMSSGSATTVPLQRSGWSSLTNAFGRGDAINIKGASGELDFDPVTEETDAVVEVWRICNDADGLIIVPDADTTTCPISS